MLPDATTTRPIARAHQLVHWSGVLKKFTSGLRKLDVNERDANIYVEVKGFRANDAVSLREVASDHALSQERVRQIANSIDRDLVHTLATDERFGDLRDLVAAWVSVVSTHAPGTCATIEDALASAADTSERAAKGGAVVGMLRLADVLGVPHSLRVTTWTAWSRQYDGGTRRVTAVVPLAMPECFEPLMTTARKLSRGCGVISDKHLATAFFEESGIALSPSDLATMLDAFSTNLGEHAGSVWHTFTQGANELIRKAATRVALFGRIALDDLKVFHERYNRSLYINGTPPIPDEVLKRLLEANGFAVDQTSAWLPEAGAARAMKRGLSQVQVRMLEVFREVQQDGVVSRGAFLDACEAAGIRRITANLYLSRTGLFHCVRGSCRLVAQAKRLAAA